MRMFQVIKNCNLDHKKSKLMTGMLAKYQLLQQQLDICQSNIATEVNDMYNLIVIKYIYIFRIST